MLSVTLQLYAACTAFHYCVPGVGVPLPKKREMKSTNSLVKWPPYSNNINWHFIYIPFAIFLIQYTATFPHCTSPWSPGRGTSMNKAPLSLSWFVLHMQASLSIYSHHIWQIAWNWRHIYITHVSHPNMMYSSDILTLIEVSIIAVIYIFLLPLDASIRTCFTQSGVCGKLWREHYL